jgi:hypothetical protein
MNRALEARASELNELYSENAMSAKLTALIKEFFQLVIKLNDETTKHTGRSPPKTLRNAKELLRRLQEFEIKVERLVPLTKHGPLLCTVLDELFDDVRHFVRSVQITNGIVKLVQGRPALRNRPSKIEAMTTYAKVITTHQSQHGTGEFPKPREAQKQLKLLGHVVPERTLRDWKRQIKNKTFGDYVQNRKRQ